MRDIQLVLERWGAWAASECSGVDWPPIAAGFKGLIPFGKKSRIQCGDDEGGKVDAAISKLRILNDDYVMLIVLHYVYLIPKRKIATRLHVNEKTVRDKILLAEHFLAGALMLL